MVFLARGVSVGNINDVRIVKCRFCSQDAPDFTASVRPIAVVERRVGAKAMCNCWGCFERRFWG
eukprot:4937547-Amphidinium_carterae.1